MASITAHRLGRRLWANSERQRSPRMTVEAKNSSTDGTIHQRSAFFRPRQADLKSTPFRAAYVKTTVTATVAAPPAHLADFSRRDFAPISVVCTSRPPAGQDRQPWHRLSARRLAQPFAATTAC